MSPVYVSGHTSKAFVQTQGQNNGNHAQYILRLNPLHLWRIAYKNIKNLKTPNITKKKIQTSAETARLID